MRRLLATIVGVSCCAATVYAGAPREDLRVQPSPTLLLVGDASGQVLFEESLQSSQNLLEPFQVRETSSLEDLTVIANKVAYVGSLLLTADLVWRSMDSVLNRMAFVQPDGTELRLKMRPSSGGFNVMLKLSRPIDF
jgi:hypothetical protein